MQSAEGVSPFRLYLSSISGICRKDFRSCEGAKSKRPKSNPSQKELSLDRRCAPYSKVYVTSRNERRRVGLLAVWPTSGCVPRTQCQRRRYVSGIRKTPSKRPNGQFALPGTRGFNTGRRRGASLRAWRRTWPEVRRRRKRMRPESGRVADEAAHHAAGQELATDQPRTKSLLCCSVPHRRSTASVTIVTISKPAMAH